MFEYRRVSCGNSLEVKNNRRVILDRKIFQRPCCNWRRQYFCIVVLLLYPQAEDETLFATIFHCYDVHIYLCFHVVGLVGLRGIHSGSYWNQFLSLGCRTFGPWFHFTCFFSLLASIFTKGKNSDSPRRGSNLATGKEKRELCFYEMKQWEKAYEVDAMTLSGNILTNFSKLTLLQYCLYNLLNLI